MASADLATPRPRQARLSQRASGYFDLARGLAAVLVMVGHLRALFFVPFGSVAQPNPAVRAFYFLTSLGHQSVMVFFVLSGWLISASVLKDVGNDRWTWRSYLTRRLTRLWIVLLPALVLCALLDRAGIALFGYDAVYGAAHEYAGVVPRAVHGRSGLDTLAGNALFLQTIVVGTFGSNGALWSLANEFWYYLMFPLLALGLARPWRQRLVPAALLVAIAVFVGAAITATFFIWLLGTAALLLAARGGHRWGRSIRVLAGATTGAVALAALALSRTGVPGLAADFSLGLAFAAALFVIFRSSSPTASQSQLGRAGKGLAAFSFTLYVVHLPLLMFLRAWAQSEGQARWQPDPGYLALAAVVAAGALAFAYGFSLMTERHTDGVRRKLLPDPGPAPTPARESAPGAAPG